MLYIAVVFGYSHSILFHFQLKLDLLRFIQARDKIGSLFCEKTPTWTLFLAVKNSRVQNQGGRTPLKVTWPFD